jgi:predicted acyl esterase
MPSFMPTFSRNLQTGARETESATTRIARLTILSGPAHPSHLTLPVLPNR